MEKSIFMVNALGIVYNSKLQKILIGRRENDPYVKKLKWGFPGGRLHHGKSIENSLKHEIKIKTNLKVNVKQLLFARIPAENQRFLLLYYFCTTNQIKVVARDKFVEVKWIKPNEAKKYFTTSLSPQLKKLLKKFFTASSNENSPARS